MTTSCFQSGNAGLVSTWIRKLQRLGGAAQTDPQALELYPVGLRALPAPADAECRLYPPAPKVLNFTDKFAQAVELIVRLSAFFELAPVLVATRELVRQQRAVQAVARPLGQTCPPDLAPAGEYGAPRVARAGTGQSRPAAQVRQTPRQRLRAGGDDAREGTQTCTLHVYGAVREVVAAERVVMLKTLRCPVRVVRVYRKTRWVALMTADLDPTIEQIIEYYSVRWIIEAGFREIKQEIGTAHTQTRNPDAALNHLNFCMAVTTLTWIYAEHLKQAPVRRYASQNTTEYAFADVRRVLAKDLANEGIGIDCQDHAKPDQNPLFSTVMRLVA